MKKRDSTLKSNLFSCLKKTAVVSAIAVSAASVSLLAQGRYIAGDFQTYTDSHISYAMKKFGEQRANSNAEIQSAEERVETDYTVPSWTLYLRALVAGETENEATKLLVSKDYPYNINTTINGDPTKQIGATWFTNAGVLGTKLQLKVGKNVTDFSTNVTEFIAVSVAVNDLDYIANSRNNDEIAELSGLPKGTKRSYVSNKVLINNLQANTTYSYRVGGINGVWSEIGTFTTAKNSKEEFEFIYITDTQANTDEMFDVSKKTIEAAHKMLPNAKFLLCAGDFVETYHIPGAEAWGYTGSAEWEWEQWFEKMQEVCLHLPIVPVQGNHDASPTHNMFHHFNTDKSYNAKQTLPAAKTAMEGTVYSFNYGDALFLVLNYEDIPIELMMLNGDDHEVFIAALADWLRAEVAADTVSKWKIATLHKSMFTGNSTHQDRRCSKFVRERMAPVFQEVGIDLVLGGHSHIYEVIGVLDVEQEGTSITYTHLPNAVTNQEVVIPTPADGTVDCVPTSSVTGKNGGTFDVSDGVLYFLNGSAGKKKYYPRNAEQMDSSFSAHAVPNYFTFFNRFGQTGEPTFSSIKVSTDTVTVATYTVDDMGIATLFDEFKLIKNGISNIANVINDGVLIYPNPTSSIFYIEGADVAKISIYNTIGNLVQTSEVSENMFDINTLPKGIYSLRITTIDNLIINKTIIKQ